MSDQIQIKAVEDISNALNFVVETEEAKQSFRKEVVKIDKLKEARYASDTNDRKWLAQWSATIVSVWLFFVFIILLKNSSSIHLSDTVLNVLLGTTTLNVLGLSFIVLRGHFNSTEHK